MLAHLLMAGLARRALLRATPRQGRERPDWRPDWRSLVGSQFGSSADVAGSYPLDALDWGIAAFVSGKATSRCGVQTHAEAELS